MTQEPTTNDETGACATDATATLDPMSSVSTWAPHNGRHVPTSLGGEDPLHFLLERAKVGLAPVCLHPQSIVHAQARVVTCRACHATLDPIAVLSEIANDATWCVDMRTQRAKLNAEIQQMTADLDRLRKQRTRVENALPLDFKTINDCVREIELGVADLLQFTRHADGAESTNAAASAQYLLDTLETITQATANLAPAAKPVKKRRKRAATSANTSARDR